MSLGIEKECIRLIRPDRQSAMLKISGYSVVAKIQVVCRQSGCFEIIGISIKSSYSYEKHRRR